ncbi:MAG: 16S rRNA (cytidine(1402)-2'-O)-methyltransferase [Gammaproteobacteria bacterium]|nr:MAG: 16S rRNA (cytidine(1402)-2'-O)-methyltransferase [Gammaproteobacteria bacterium]
MKTGTLYIVATPIGHLDDITLRAVETLKTVDLVAAEDTRMAQRLLHHLGIRVELISFHNYNEASRAPSLLEKLQQGVQMALISDAGTPLINDPGFMLVHEARRLGIPVVPIPGACAAIAALSVSGLPANRFSYEGFLPKKAPERRRFLHALQRESRTMIFYESPHRVVSTLEMMCEVFGEERQGCLAKELTKIHETVVQQSLAGLLSWCQQHPDRIRGEFVLLLEGCSNQERMDHDWSAESIMKLLLPHMKTRTAAAVAAQLTGRQRNELYQLALELTPKES